MIYQLATVAISSHGQFPKIQNTQYIKDGKSNNTCKHNVHIKKAQLLFFGFTQTQSLYTRDLMQKSAFAYLPLNFPVWFASLNLHSRAVAAFIAETLSLSKLVSVTPKTSSLIVVKWC